MNTLLCSELLGHILISTEDPRLLASIVLRVCKLWNSLVELELFWKQLYGQLFLFSALRTPAESWRAACLRLGMLEPRERTEALLSNFETCTNLRLEVKSIFTNTGHTYFPYFAPLHRIYPGGYALLLFKLNKIDTQQTMEQKLEAIKGTLPYVEERQRLNTLAEFWTAEVQYWRNLGKADSKEELQGLGTAMENGNLYNARAHMKMWFDKIQMWIMGPSNLFETLFQKEIIFNKEFVQSFFPDVNTNYWIAFWRELRLQSLVSLEDL